MNTDFKIGAAYIRVSDERQDEYSPDSQLKKIREYAEKERTVIPDEFVFYDDGISGKSAKKRDSFNRMIALAKEKNRQFEVIYVWKFSRFARNQEESMVYKNLLRKRGVSVVSVSEPIPEGHYGTLIERIIEWMDEFYLVNLGTEVTRGMTEKASRGEPVSIPPFGYVLKDGKLYPDEESGNAEIVREIFRLYASGVKIREITIMMGERGIRTRRENIPENRWVSYILQNPCYTGKIRWSTEGAQPVTNREVDLEKILIVDGHHEPLISKELWDKVQAMIEEQKRVYPKYARREQPVNYMLKGLVRCSSCGGTLAINGVSGKERTPCLQCCNYSRGSCHVSHGITLPKLEAAFMDGLNMAFESRSFAISPKRERDGGADSVNYDRLIAIEERRLARAREAYLAEIDTLEQYARNKKQITEKIEDLTRRKERTVQKPIDLEAFSKQLANVIAFISQDGVDASAKNEAIRSVVEKVILEKPSGNLSIFFHGG